MRSRALMWIAVCVTAISAITLAVASASGATTSVARTTAAAAAKQPKQVEVYATYYGWYDNTPPGCATAYSGCARGNGTYAHPITLQTYPERLSWPDVPAGHPIAGSSRRRRLASPSSSVTR